MRHALLLWFVLAYFLSFLICMVVKLISFGLFFCLFFHHHKKNLHFLQIFLFILFFSASFQFLLFLRISFFLLLLLFLLLEIKVIPIRFLFFPYIVFVLLKMLFSLTNDLIQLSFLFSPI